MGSGRGDRNQEDPVDADAAGRSGRLQWGPVVVTGISRPVGAPTPAGDRASMGSGRGDRNQFGSIGGQSSPDSLQWGPVVVTGIRGYRMKIVTLELKLQWGPVVVTGIRTVSGGTAGTCGCFNGVRSW